MSGHYFVFEGVDGCGKSTAMKKVAEKLQKHINSEIILTRHPGATPLGAHLRQLIKYPDQINPDIKIDELSQQILMMVDTVAFIRQLLIPSLDAGKVVFADRSSFISAMAYGLASNLTIVEVNQLFQLIQPPEMTRLYVLRCPWELAHNRLAGRSERPDHWDLQTSLFKARVQEVYDNLLTGPPERTMVVNYSVALHNVIEVDATRDPSVVADDIYSDMCGVLAK